MRPHRVRSSEMNRPTSAEPRAPAPSGRPAMLEISVALADDHRLVREGLRRVLEGASDLRVAFEAGDGDALLDALRAQPVDVVVLDLSMPGLSGMALIERLKTDFPQVAVLVLTMHADAAYALRAFRAGANGYLTKDGGGAELVQAIRKVAAGGGYVNAALAEKLAVGLHRQGDRPLHEGLSERELEVFRRLVDGQRPSDIAGELHLSVKTVSTHKARILEKLGLDSTAALVKYGIENRLFDDAQ